MKTLYTTPFSGDYWRSACLELKKPLILAFAAMMIVLRVVLKAVEIPVGPYLNITTGFFVNALGAMVFGPIVALLAAMITDTLGCMLFPVGPYFFPFIFVEMTSSLIFALFLYRTKLTAWRVLLSRFSVMVICNLILNPALLVLYNRMVLGGDYAFLALPRVIKNLCLFPAESFLLLLFLNVMRPITNRMGFTYGNQEKLRFTKQHVIGLIALTLVSAAAVAFYSYYRIHLK